MVRISVVITVSAAHALQPPTRKPCEQVCTLDYTPVCAAPPNSTKASDKKSFGNSCVLSNYNCQNNANLVVVSKDECPGGGSVRLA